ncbi:MAG: hypothetical protein DLM58_17280 [Pseudonocardiales bacterium]|nr:MAG: hypothetical protein DLM58_17280 [Pseudonocardiales bacterium]
MAAPHVVDLSDRDRAILSNLLRVRLLTGRQLERLHFASLATANARASDRRRVLGRLVKLKLITTLPRRVGGVRAGSAGLIYALDSRALRLRALWLDEPPRETARIRRPWAVGWQFVQHTLDISELYIRLRERERLSGDKLLHFETEPISWHRTGNGVLKPDAYAVYEAGRWEEHRWLEIDRATESLPTVRRKLLGYLDAVAGAAPGPNGVMPQVLVTVSSARRLDAVRSLLETLPPPADRLISVHCFNDVFGSPARPPP